MQAEVSDMRAPVEGVVNILDKTRWSARTARVSPILSTTDDLGGNTSAQDSCILGRRRSFSDMISASKYFAHEQVFDTDTSTLFGVLLSSKIDACRVHPDRSSSSSSASCVSMDDAHSLSSSCSCCHEEEEGEEEREGKREAKSSYEELLQFQQKLMNTSEHADINDIELMMGIAASLSSMTDEAQQVESGNGKKSKRSHKHCRHNEEKNESQKEEQERKRVIDLIAASLHGGDIEEEESGKRRRHENVTSAPNVTSVTTLEVAVEELRASTVPSPPAVAMQETGSTGTAPPPTPPPLPAWLEPLQPIVEINAEERRFVLVQNPIPPAPPLPADGRLPPLRATVVPAPPAPPVPPPPQERLCNVCYCPFSSTTSLERECVFAGEGNDRICNGCMLEYLKVEIREGKVPLKTPFKKLRIVPYGMVKKMLTTNNELEALEKYERFRALKNDPNARECPSCNYIQAGNPETPNMQCEQCSTRYCFFHSLQHPGKKCWRYALENPISSMKSNLYKYFRTKKCPKCKNYVERNSGCEHMTCKCGQAFCWRCGGVYYNNNYYHKKLVFFRPRQWKEVCHSKAMWTARVASTIGIVAAFGPAVALSPIILPILGFIKLHRTYNLKQRYRQWLQRRKREKERRKAMKAHGKKPNPGECAHYFPTYDRSRCMFCNIHYTSIEPELRPPGVPR
uniref:RBR-type E3 ubiquitin transferase n=1 Tax=Palpitomonas bilix TaxID=652834 RepID=A0A7S3G5H3_9EUKA|mmetsp:Transcript_20608/g.52976  ORF Transcript_20608/g.52976 Transcript_20608/m.52976 type:complete len:683 (+) Transcript_20608:233-2281(+)